MILLIDNFDSFTYNLSQYLRMLGEEVVVRRNDAIDGAEVRKLAPRLIVISPGPGGPADTGKCIEMLDAFHREIPFFGICLGMQTIAAYFGGRIVEATVPVHGKVRRVVHDGKGVFNGLENPLNVTRYHSLIVEEGSLPDSLEVNARSESGEIMGLQHKVYPIFGVQFHPEAYLTEGGLALLRNALEATR
ncbi:aminodeoxychorismate/anthranilate synthase component II [Pelagicoccus sp. SDUM812002]|uniref:anthranilate synthase component II n=1 Tax=Pelagicoccus sp. SDUM812002 TaxID=3041266 RepID=UPI00280FE8D7|nr:aminodeoxychorismate/anthranilate synthase component II [Pelagicoccus sp. SDUM812002]MDQ8186459.1 aminodeoxychorismate/anthranilate synthase component II [Pelagicoccus sp. SDUM812002]